MTHKCEIQWIDAKGVPTPDTNPAIGMVRCKEHSHHMPFGDMVHYETSRWFYICAAHAERLSTPECVHWEFKELDQ